MMSTVSPSPADPRKITTKRKIPCPTCSRVLRWAISGRLDSRTVVVKTMATASFNIDSPNT